MTREKSNSINTQLVLTIDVQRRISDKQCQEILTKAPEIVSVILYNSLLDENFFQKQTQILVPIIQKANCAAIIADNSQIMGRSKADGIHYENDVTNLLKDNNSVKIIS